MRFARYTGQEKGDEREAIRSNPPDILLTNYMMLELLLTRREDRALVQGGPGPAVPGLRRAAHLPRTAGRGRRAADPALPPGLRRARHHLRRHFGDDGQRRDVARPEDGSREGRPDAVRTSDRRRRRSSARHSSERRQRLTGSTPRRRAAARRRRSRSTRAPPDDYEAFRLHPLSSWIESTFGVRDRRRHWPTHPPGATAAAGDDSAAEELAELDGD